MEYKTLITKLKVYNDIKQYALTGKLAQAYLFLSPDKFTNAELLLALSKLLLCKNGSACGVCEHCAKINAGTHPDVLVFPKDKNFVVDDASKIYDTVQVKPMLSNKKIYIINGIDNATEQAQNKLLKIIEEPPQNVIFLISANTEEKVLSTILSRVFKHHVEKFDEDVLKMTLNGVEKQTANIAISFGDGYLGKTLELASNANFIEYYKNMKNLICNLKKSEQIPYFSGYFSKDKTCFEESLKILNDFFRDVLMIKIDQQQEVKNKDLQFEFLNLSAEYSIQALTKIIENLTQIKKKLDSNVNLTVLADNLLFDILEVKFLCK
ncbi:MAG: hypothetical protein IJ318_03225 [Clostridia bacterium]|nr:hypothetical protein [Clostridia bacterium]